jgi:CheY-like chemotaxis protein
MAKILVIDDNDVLGKLVSRMLQSEGHEVITASDGKQGVALFSERLPDLVITDLIMPDMDGVETIVALRKIAPETKIIAMSGGGDAASGPDYLNSMNAVLNISSVIAKPFEKAELLKAVNDVLN